MFDHFGKSSIDMLELKAVSLLSLAFAKFAVDQELESVPQLQRIDLRRTSYTSREGTHMTKLEVSGFVLYGKILMRFSTQMFGPYTQDMYLDSIVWLTIYGTKAHIYPLAGEPGNLGIGSWERHPVVFQLNHEHVKFTDFLESIEIKTV